MSPSRSDEHGQGAGRGIGEGVRQQRPGPVGAGLAAPDSPTLRGPIPAAGGQLEILSDAILPSMVGAAGALTPQLSTVQRLSNAAAFPKPSASDQAEATAADDEATPSSTTPPEAGDTAAEEPGDTDPVSPEHVDVRVLDRKDVEPAGCIGLGLQVTRTDGGSVPGPVQVDIDHPASSAPSAVTSRTGCSW